MHYSYWTWRFMEFEIFNRYLRLVEMNDAGSTKLDWSYSWNLNDGSKHLLSLKAPTCLLLTPEILEKDMVTADITGKPVLAVDVFALYINTMKDHLVNIMKINEDDIEWILTVPKRWACVVEQLIQCMKKSGKKAGIDELPLRICIVDAPEATSISCKNILIDYLRGTFSYRTVEYNVVKFLIGDLGDEVDHLRRLIIKIKDVPPLSFCWNIKQVLTEAKHRMHWLERDKEDLEGKFWLEPSDRAYRKQSLSKQIEHVENLLFFLNYSVQDADYHMERLIRKRGNWHRFDPLYRGLYYLLTQKIPDSSSRKQHTKIYGFLQLQKDADYRMERLIRKWGNWHRFDPLYRDADYRMGRLIRKWGNWHRFDPLYRDYLNILVELPNQSTKIQTEYAMPKRKEKTYDDHECLKLKEDDLVIPVELPNQSTKIQTEYEMLKRKEKTDDDHDCLKLKEDDLVIPVDLPNQSTKIQTEYEMPKRKETTDDDHDCLKLKEEQNNSRLMENNLSDKEGLKHEQLDKRQPNAIRIERRG